MAGNKSARILLIGIVIGVIAGILSGWFVGKPMESVAWLGELFLNALKMLILPLIIAAVVSGIVSLGDVRKFGRLGGSTLLFFVFTSLMAVVVGLVVVNLIGPGVGVNLPDGGVPETVAEKEAVGFKEILLSLISPNLIKSAYDLQLLPIIIFAMLFAAALSQIPDNKVMVDFFHRLNDVMMKLVNWVMWFAPIGIFALIAGRLGKAGGGEEFLVELEAVGKYVVTVLVALGVHFVLLLLIATGFAKRSFRFLGTMSRALFTAFGTASSSATVPVTMECARAEGVNKKSLQFAIPLGSTINMNGTALYEAVAVLFIAQVYGMDLSLGEQIIVALTATLAAIGAAGIPEAGLVTMVIVLNAVGLPLDGVGLILTVDWFLDRFRTAVNVWGDAVASVFVDRLIQLGVVPDSSVTPDPENSSLSD